MGNDILRAIIEVEDEIHKGLLAEQRQSDERLAQLRLKCEQEVAREEARLQEELVKMAHAAAGGEARERARTVLAEAAAQAERLGRLDDATLRQLLRREISHIVPGKKP